MGEFEAEAERVRARARERERGRERVRARARRDMLLVMRGAIPYLYYLVRAHNTFVRVSSSLFGSPTPVDPV